MPAINVSAFCSAWSNNAKRAAHSEFCKRSMASRINKRKSVATWSLRERAVCNRLPASPTSSISRRSMLKCTSSSSSRQVKSPCVISCEICCKPRAMAALSSWLIMFCAANISACASEAVMSYCANRLSKCTDALKRAMRSSGGMVNNADQFLALSDINDIIRRRAACVQ